MSKTKKILRKIIFIFTLLALISTVLVLKEQYAENNETSDTSKSPIGDGFSSVTIKLGFEDEKGEEKNHEFKLDDFWKVYNDDRTAETPKRDFTEPYPANSSQEIYLLNNVFGDPQVFCVEHGQALHTNETGTTRIYLRDVCVFDLSGDLSISEWPDYYTGDMGKIILRNSSGAGQKGRSDEGTIISLRGKL